MAKNRTPLRRAIFESGRTQRSVADAIGVSESRMSLIVNGLHVDELTRQKISAALGREISDLWPDHMERAA